LSICVINLGGMVELVTPLHHQTAAMTHVTTNSCNLHHVQRLGYTQYVVVRTIFNFTQEMTIRLQIANTKAKRHNDGQCQAGTFSYGLDIILSSDRQRAMQRFNSVLLYNGFIDDDSSE